MTKFSLNLGATLLPTEASDSLKRPGKGTNQIYRTDLHIILVNLKHVLRCLFMFIMAREWLNGYRDLLEINS